MSYFAGELQGALTVGRERVFVPVPRSGNSLPSFDPSADEFPCLALCQALEQRGLGPAVDLLVRTTAVRPSSGGDRLSVSEHLASLATNSMTEAASVILVDDILATGATIMGCALTLRLAGYVGDIGAICPGQDPLPVNDETLRLRQGHRLRWSDGQYRPERTDLGPW